MAKRDIMNPIFIYLIIALVSSFLCYGIYYAWTVNKYPTLKVTREDLGFSIIFSLLTGFGLGPIGVLTFWCLSGFGQYGFKIK